MGSQGTFDSRGTVNNGHRVPTIATRTTSLQEKPRAITILTAGKRGANSYVFEEDALRLIIDKPEYAGKPVAIVSVAGAFRKGKSFMLNFFVHYLEWLSGGSRGDWFSEDLMLDKFHFRGGSERDTQGIQMWSQPFLLKQNGKELVVLLMDTQGTFDSSTTIRQCATIFALSTMISSLQIYNISQNIQEDDLQHLQLFTEYGKLATQQGNSKPFQSLMFLIRDWSNDHEYKYGFEGGQDFLDNKFKVSSDQATELRNLRKEIRGVFEKIECFLMPHPGLRIAKNQTDKRVGAVEEDFGEEIKRFVPAVFGEKLHVKKIAGRSLTCSEILQYFKAYVDVFQGDSLPEPMSIYTVSCLIDCLIRKILFFCIGSPKCSFLATAEAALMTIVANSKAIYDQAMSKVVHGPPPLENVETYVEHHMNYQKRAVQHFDATPKLGNADLAAKHLSALQKHIDGRYQEFLKVVSAQQKLMESAEALDQLEMKRQAALKEEKQKMEKLNTERDEKARKDKAEMEKRQQQYDEQHRQNQLAVKRERELMEEQARKERKENERRIEAAREEIRRESRERSMMYSGGGGSYHVHVHSSERSSPQPSGKYDRNGRWHGPDGRFAVDPNK